MEMSGPSLGSIRFGLYELDADASELRKNGVKLKLQDQPFQVLVALLEHHGKIVTREDLRQRVWPGHTFVDFDQGLNTAIAKIREALGDSASNPRFVETVPRRGYRFIAPVELSEPAMPAQKPPPPVRKPTRDVLVGILIGLVTGVALTLWLQTPRESEEPPLRRFVYTPEEPVEVARISPDGKYIAYTAGNPTTLWLLDLERFESRQFEGTSEARQPFWPPDSESVCYFTRYSLKKISRSGGGVVDLRDFSMDATPPLAGAWTADGDSLVVCRRLSDLYEASLVPGHGGPPEDLSALDAKRLDNPLPLFESTDGTVTFFVDTGKQRGLVALDPETGRFVDLPESDRRLSYSPTGHLFFRRPYLRLFARPFSIRTGRSVGPPFPIAQHASLPSVSRDGTMAYVRPTTGTQQLIWVDRNGQKQGDIGGPQERIRCPALSPDGNYVAVAGIEDGRKDIWIHDVRRVGKKRLTFESGEDHRPIWRPGGDQITFRRSGGGLRIYSVPADGSAAAQAFLPNSGEAQPSDWSPDGRYLVYQRTKQTSDLWYWQTADDGAEPTTRPFLITPFPTRVAKFSPDGRFLAFCTNKSGKSDVYVQPFPEGGREWKISPDGGVQPRWNPNGKELFYVKDGTLFGVPVTLTPDFSAGTPEPLFSHPGLASNYPEQTYDVAADGQRFVIVENLDSGERPSIHIIQNWFAEFRERE